MNIFEQLQNISSARDVDIPSIRDKMDAIVAFFENKPDYETQLKYFSNLRKIKVETLKQVNSFMVDPDANANELPNELRRDYFGMCRGNHYLYSGRFVFPVKDVKGHTMGWCGYDKFETPKYLDSHTIGYVAKETSLYGMECMEEYYNSTDPIFVVEGIMCALWLRENSFKSLALLGSYMTPYVITILSRFKDRLIVIPDSDAAGNRLAAQCKYKLPKARVVQSRVAKDVDDSRFVISDLADDLNALTSHKISKYFIDYSLMSRKF